MKLGCSFVTSHPNSPTISDQMAMFRDIGFHTCFIGADTLENMRMLPMLAERAAARGIPLSGFRLNSHALWISGADGDYSLSVLQNDIDVLSFSNVPVAVIRSGKTDGDTCEGIARFQRLGEYAMNKQVKLLLENDGNTAHFALAYGALGENGAFCYNTGHHLCYEKDQPLLETYGADLAFTQLHDNHGTTDEHLLPFDGKYDWKTFGKTLQSLHYDGVLNAEIACGNSDLYCELPFERLVIETFSRLKRIEVLSRSASKKARGRSTDKALQTV